MHLVRSLQLMELAPNKRNNVRLLIMKESTIIRILFNV